MDAVAWNSTDLVVEQRLVQSGHDLSTFDSSNIGRRSLKKTIRRTIQ